MINKNKKEVQLPEVVEKYLDNNFTFNKFGIVNIKFLKSVTGCDIKDNTLKRLINARFASEMQDNKIEFI